MEAMRESILYEKRKSKAVRCLTCAHYCVLKPNGRGRCGARVNLGGKLYFPSDGVAVSRAVEPIEKKLLFHFLPGTLTFSFAGASCNFICQNCRNRALTQSLKEAKIFRQKTASFGEKISPKRIVEEALSLGCSSVSCALTEPAVFLEYALDTMKLAKKEGLKNAWASNGFLSPESRKKIIPHLDAININLKAANEKFYREVCGGKLKPVLETCQELKAANVWLEIGTDLISGLAGQTENLKQIAYFIAEKLGPETPWHLSRLAQKKDVQNRPLKKISLKQVRQAYEIGKNAGLTYVYLDDIPRAKEKNTFCPRCKIENINRSGFRAHRLDKKGLCRECGFDLNIAG